MRDFKSMAEGRAGMWRLTIIAGLVSIAAAVSSSGVAPAHGALPIRLDSGPLRLEVDRDPFAIQFLDEKSGQTLHTLDDPLPAPDDQRARYGPLGYSFDLRQPVVNNAFLGYYSAAESETVWFHATRVISAERQGNRLELVAATNDPLGHRLLVSAAPQGNGGMTIHSRIAPGSGPLVGQASLSGAAFLIDQRERFLGFGERSNAADQTGNRVFNWAEEGPFSSGRGEDIFRPLVPDFTFPTGPTASNFPMPWTVSSRGFGFLIENTHRSTFRLGNERRDSWHAEAEAPSFAFTVFAGPRPADVVRRYSAYAGRQPRPAPWIFGPWFQPTLEREPYELAQRFRQTDVPVTVAQTYTHYLPCGAHVGKRRQERERAAAYHALGYKITTYFNPHICTEYQPVYDEAAQNGWLVKNAAGDPYILSNPFTADEQVSEVDFTSAGAVAFYGRLLDEAIDDGYDGWMEDFGEYTPTDSVFSDGRRGLEMHNLYPVLYHCASYGHTRERYGRDAAVYIRSGWHGAQPCARVVWGGDPTEDWSCSDGLCAAVHQALSIGMSGIAYWGSDIGGFHAVVNPRTSDELNIRWLQFGAFSGVMRTQANGFSFQSNRAERSQVWHKDVLPIWDRYSELRTQLLPYIEASSAVYQRTGMPISRHLALVYPGDERAVRQQEEFLFGPFLFVAPVLKPGARDRTFYLPPGPWVNLWRSVRYRARGGAFLLRRAKIVRGGREVTVAAPREEIPLLARAGALLPMLPADVDTLAPEGRGRGLVHLKDRRGKMRLIVLPRGRTGIRLADGTRIRSLERRGRWHLRIRGRARRSYRIEASMKTLKRPFRPCAVKRNGRALARKAWSFSRRGRVLRVRARLRTGTITALRRC